MKRSRRAAVSSAARRRGRGSALAKGAVPIVLLAGVVFPSTGARAETRERELTARDLMPLEARRGVFRVRDRRAEKERRVPFVMRRTKSRWVLTKKDWARHTFVTDEGGAIRIARESDFREGLVIGYADPVMLLPARPDGAVERSGETRVTLRYLESGRIKDRGTCRWRLRSLEPRRIETALGAFETHRFALEREIDLGITHVNIEVVFAYAPGVGQVHAEVTRKAEALWLFGDEAAWTAELVERAAEPERTRPAR